MKNKENNKITLLDLLFGSIFSKEQKNKKDKQDKYESYQFEEE